MQAACEFVVDRTVKLDGVETSRADGARDLFRVE